MTSHDVVAVARRALHEKRIGHTGTLDPMATGVLPLACGRATRLARFFSASDKDYDATIQFGLETDSYDITGTVVARSGRVPQLADVAEALTSVRGRYLQLPPGYSAKKVAGKRAYTFARAQQPVALTAVPVDVSRADILGVGPDTVTLGLTVSAGFYVRTLAHELGQRLGTGACLSALRRTRSGSFSTADAALLDAADLRTRLVPLDRLLPDMPAVTVTETGLTRVVHGQVLLPSHYAASGPARSTISDGSDLDQQTGSAHGTASDALPGTTPGTAVERQEHWTRLVDARGALLAIARPGSEPGALHPAIVLV
jgi:tRNA pseudouridine55 synthase